MRKFGLRAIGILARPTVVCGCLVVAGALPLPAPGAPLRSGDPFPTIPGWDLKTEEAVYVADNLWEYIDGAADLYVSYGFVDLHVAYYSDGRGIEVRAELYRHASDEDAYGIYAQERSPESPPARFGCEGYQDTGMLNFTSGQWYVKLSSNQAGEPAAIALATVAGAIDTSLGGSSALPAGFSSLPQLRRVPRSEQYIARDFLGYGFLQRAYTARYARTGSCEAFVLCEEQPSDALKVLDAFKTVAGVRSPAGSDGVFEFDDPHAGLITVVAKGNLVFGVLPCGDEELLTELLRNFQALR